MEEVAIEHRAVAYLVTHQDEAPEDVKLYLKDLFGYEESGKNLQTVLNEAHKTIAQVESRMEQLYGAIDAMVRIISRQIGEEKVLEFGNKYKKD